jgi:RNA polymerase sigma factor (sigma-70 family)
MRSRPDLHAALQKMRDQLQPARELADAELLARFRITRDGEAFAAIVHRHGPLIQAACRRLLTRGEDVEDVFQATFLVLSRNPDRVRKPEALGSWLYGVAYRLAARLRAAESRQQKLRQARPPEGPADPLAGMTARELLQALDDEIQRLPENERAPMVCCYLQGRAREDVAREQGLSMTTLYRRLERGRERLRLRLQQRGLDLPSLLTPLALGTIRLPALLLQQTVQAALNSDPTAWRTGAGVLAAADFTWSLTMRSRVILSLCVFTGLLGFGLAGAERSAPGTPVGLPLPSAAASTREGEGAKGEAEREALRDVYGDPLPAGAVVRLGTVRFRNHAKQVVFSPDGKTLASGGHDGSVRLWDFATGKEIQQCVGHTAEVNCVSFSSDGKGLASASTDLTIRLWDAASGKELGQCRGHKAHVVCVSFSPDGKRLVSASWDGTIRLWDVATAKEIRQYLGHTDSVFSVSLSPDGKTVASGGADKTIRLWDVATGYEIRQCVGHKKGVSYVSFSPDGKNLASAGFDKTIRLWDVATGKELRPFRQQEDGVACVRFSPDGKSLVSGGNDRTIRLWEVATGKELRQYSGHAGNFSFDFESSVCFSPDGQNLASAGFDGTIRVWDAATGKEIRQDLGHVDSVIGVCFSPDGKSLASAGDRTIRVWETATGKEVRQCVGHTNFVTSVRFSPDGKTLASGSDDKTIRLWEVATGKEIRQCVGHTHKVTSISFSPDGKTLASGSQDKTIRLWEVATGKEIRQCVGHTNFVTSVSFSPDGKSLASASWDKTVRLWEVATGKEIRQCVGNPLVATFVSFSPDGKSLAASAGYENTIRLWDVATGKEIRQWVVPNKLLSVSFSPDGKSLASASLDGTIRLWEAASGKERLILPSKAGGGKFRIMVARRPTHRFRTRKHHHPGLGSLWGLGPNHPLYRKGRAPTLGRPPGRRRQGRLPGHEKTVAATKGSHRTAGVSVAAHARRPGRTVKRPSGRVGPRRIRAAGTSDRATGEPGRTRGPRAAPGGG